MRLVLELKMPELKLKKRVDERERRSPCEPQLGSVDGVVEEQSIKNIIEALNSVRIIRPYWAVFISAPVLLCLD